MNYNDSDGDMSLDEGLVYCIWSGENKAVIRTLQEMNSCDLKNSISGRTLLHVAADSDNVIIAQYLIDRGCKVDVVDNRGDTPLILACQQDYTDVIKLLVEAKASVLISNNDNESAAKIILGDNTESRIFVLDAILKRVKEECSNDSLRTAKELLEARCSLPRAVRLRDTAITRYMLDNGCNINDQDQPLQGWTPLHQALVFKDNENAKLLIDRGADVNIGDVNGLTPVSHASNFEILEILLNKGAKVVDNNGTLVAPDLFSYWQKEVIEMLIERFNLANLSVKDRDGTTLFHHIVSNVALDPVEILQKHFKSSIDVNQKDREGSTALLKTVKAGNVGTVEFLLKRGAQLDASEDDNSEVYYAVIRNCLKENREDREKILMILLQYGADIQWTSEDNRGNQYFTLDFVLRKKHYAMAKIILARLALVEDLGGEIKNLYRQKIDDTAMCKKYFEFCKQTIEKLKRTFIKRRVTLYEFMTCSEERLINFARSEEFVETVQSMMYHKRNSNLYYFKVLRKRVQKVVDVVKLQKDSLWCVNVLMPELHNNRLVIEKIVEYINYDILCFMARQPTFKCIVDNE